MVSKVLPKAFALITNTSLPAPPVITSPLLGTGDGVHTRATNHGEALMVAVVPEMAAAKLRSIVEPTSEALIVTVPRFFSSLRSA